MKARLILVHAACAALPSSALACSACQDPREQNQSAFLFGTVLLSLLPLLMAGALTLFLRHRLRGQQTSPVADDQVLPTSPSTHG